MENFGKFNPIQRQMEFSKEIIESEGAAAVKHIIDAKRKGEIEHLAWEAFLRKSGIRFKRELTPEEMSHITSDDSFEYYREVATKLYEKKLKSVLNKKYPVIEIDADGKSGMNGGAYTLCFVYSKYKGNFVLKGYMREVEDYLKKNHTHYFCNYSLWNLGGHRDIWKFWKDNVGVFEPSRYKKGVSKESLKFQVRHYSFMLDENDEMLINKFSFKRMPKRWITEFDKF